MSQDATRQSFARSPAAASRVKREPFADVRTASGGFSVESYADRLMDDLFEDVEQALKLGVELAEPPQPLPPLPAVAEPPPAEAGSAIALPLAVSQLKSEVLAQLKREVLAEEALALPELPTTAEVGAVADKPQPPVKSYDRLLIGISCVSIIISLAIWLINQEWQRQTALVPAIVPSPIVPDPAKQANRQFADYVQQSLQAIGQRQPTTPSTTATATALPNPTLPTVTVPATPGTPSPAKPLIPATGRLKMPVYPVPPTLLPSTTPVAPLPGAVPGGAPGNVKPAVPFTAPGLARTLTGIVDMGNEQSAVLIEINGVVQRFRVGESLGSSGWTLVEVSGNQAVIRRNGEVRSIFIGQSF